MSIFFAMAGEQAELSSADLQHGLFRALEKLGPRTRILAIPPDISRFHSRAGELTQHAHKYFGDKLNAVLPALGTHSRMSPEQIAKMFGQTPLSIFRTHNWREDVVTLGEVPAEYIREQSEGKLNYSWPAQVNRLVVDGSYDLILSIGQVVPPRSYRHGQLQQEYSCGHGRPGGN